MKRFTWSWDSVLIASVVIMAGLLTQVRQSAHAAENVEPEGPIVQIGSDPDVQPEFRREVRPDKSLLTEEAPSYWIGIQGRNVTEPVLRTQLQLAQDMGVVIEQVVQDSPASKAGLRGHDILLRANGEGLQSMEDLSRLVRSGDGKPIRLLLIRLGKEETIVVVPEERPQDMVGSEFGLNQGEVDRLRRNGLDPFGNRLEAFRMFPGAFVFPPQGAMASLNSFPNGYSVAITRENDQPAKITVKKGDQTWTVAGDDQEALDELPEEVREHVRGLLARSGDGAFGGGLNELQEQLRNFQLRGLPGGRFDLPQGLPFDDQQDPVLERMEELERQLNELQQRLEESPQTR